MNARSGCKSLKSLSIALRRGAVSLVLATAVGFSAGALAANTAITDCDRVESSLRSLEVPIDELTGEMEVETTEGLSATGSTPVIHLTRRATTLSREVFEALPIVLLSEDGAQDDEGDSLAVRSTESAPETSPVVLAPVTPQAAPKTQDPADTPGPPDMPRFQLLMYRTDI